MLTVQQKQLADINNLGIVSIGNAYHVVSEWSLDSIESYNTITGAIDFLRGFKSLPIGRMSTEYMDGKIMKSFLLADGYEYRKLIDIDSKYGTMIKIS